MIRKFLILIIFLLIAQLSISQPGLTSNEYPKLYISENNDTLLLLTIDQVKKLNVLKLEKDKYKELTDSLNRQVSDYELVIIQDKELINNLKEQLILKGKIINEKDGIVSELTDKNKKIEKKLNRNVFFNKVLIVGVGILTVLVLVK